VRNAPRWAKVGITIQFLALVRCLGEVYRLRWLRGQALVLADVQPFIAGALVAAVLCRAGVTLFFFARYRAAVTVSALTVAALVALKLATDARRRRAVASAPMHVGGRTCAVRPPRSCSRGDTAASWLA